MNDAALAVDVSSLSREYRSGANRTVALDGLSLSVPNGEIHGLLGPNGAGKTTLVRILSTALVPSSGTARVLGFDVSRQPRKIRPHIGVVFGGEKGLFPELTGRENLQFWAAMYRLRPDTVASTITKLLEEVDLMDRADDLVSRYSRGMKQRLHLARGIISTPSVLFLDEPTIGMDPVAAQAFRRTMTRLANMGATILLTTHDMREAAAVCQRVTFINKGRAVATTDPRQIGSLLLGGCRIEFATEAPAQMERLRAFTGAHHPREVPGQPGHYEITLGTAAQAVPIMQGLVASGVDRVTLTEPTLEEAYLHLIKDAGQ